MSQRRQPGRPARELGESSRFQGTRLAIPHDLVRLHGGDVDVQSLGVGHGATFAVTFRASDAPALPPGESRPAPQES